jgi:hypothetical protein
LNVIQIMYDNWDPNEPMVNREEHVTSIRLNLWTYTQNNKSNWKCVNNTRPYVMNIKMSPQWKKQMFVM